MRPAICFRGIIDIDMVRYRLYIDESGDHAYGKKEIKLLNIKGTETVLRLHDYPDLEVENKRYLGLTGCIVETEYYKTQFHPQMEELKKKHFTYDPDNPVIFHRKELINKQGAFWKLRDTGNEVRFNTDLLDYLSRMAYIVITVVIDKKAHIERYGESAYHPYHYCLTAMLERYCGFLHFRNAKGDIMAESRKGAEDTQLKGAYRHIHGSGTQFRKPKFFKDVLTTNEIKLKQKTSNIAGLQLSDLIAYPLKQEILVAHQCIAEQSQGQNFRHKICEIINKSKYNRHQYQERIEGYGKVFLK